MTNKDFLSSVQKLCHQDSSHCSMWLNALCRLMAQAGVEQISVTIDGLGTFISHKHPEYIQEDPLTGQQTLYPPRITYRMHLEQPSDERNYLAERLADHTRTNEEDCQRFLDAMVSVIRETLAHNEEVEVHGLGTFRIISNSMGDLQRIAYSPDDQMRSLVNAPFNCFEPVAINAPIKEKEVPIAEEPAKEEEPIVEEPTKEEEPIVEEPTKEVPAVDPIAEKTANEEKTEQLSVNEESAIAAVAAPIIEEKPQDPVSLQEPVSRQEPVSLQESVIPQESVSNNMQKEEQYYEEEAEVEERKHRRMPLILTLAGLLLILVGSIFWFVFFKVENRDASVVAKQEPPVQYTQPSAPNEDAEEVLDTTFVSAADSLADMLAQNEADLVNSDADNNAANANSATANPAEDKNTAEVAKPTEAAKPADNKPVTATNPYEKAKPAEAAKPATQPASGVSPVSPTPTAVWRIQFLTAGEVYAPGDSHLGGLTPVNYYREAKYYKYTYGAAANKADLSEALKTVRKVFKDAFFVQFNADGTRVK